MIRYCSYFFLCFVAVGAFASWLAPFLDYRGVSATAIGYGFAVVSVGRALLPPLWGTLADRLTRKEPLLAVVTLGAGCSFLVLFFEKPPELLFAGMVVFGLFFAPLFPLLDAQVISFLGDERQQYARMRLFGSLGFLVASFAIGPMVEAAGLRIVPWILTTPLLLSAGIAAFLPTGRSPTSSSPEEMRTATINWRALTPVLAVVVLAQASHGPYWSYFAIFLGQRDVSPTVIGLILATAIAAEILFMAMAPAFLRRFGARSVLLMGISTAALRWLLCSVTANLGVLWASQLLHAGSYAMVYVAGVALVDDASPPDKKAFGQTVLSSCSHGIGLGGGFVVAGMLVDELAFQGLAVLASVACVVGAVILRATRSHSEQ